MFVKSRMFGSKRGIEGNPPGKIEIYNEQEALNEIDEDGLLSEKNIKS